jgi:hypothetical protein
VVHLDHTRGLRGEALVGTGHIVGAEGCGHRACRLIEATV